MNITLTRIWHRLTRPYRTRQKRRLEAVLRAYGIPRNTANAVTNRFFSRFPATTKDHHAN